MNTKSIIFIFTSILSSWAWSQVLITDSNQNSLTIHQDAALELRGVNHDKGIIFPRVSLSATNLTNPFQNHIEGMIVYNNQSAGSGNSAVSPGLYYNDGGGWLRISVNKPTVGDIKYTSQTSDHDGWYLLNGRLTSSLPSIAQANASNLGFTIEIPNATGRYLKSKSASENLGSVGGNSSIVLTQANLPNVTFTGTTNSAGSHSHGYNDRGNGSVQSAEINNVSKADNIDVNRSTGAAGDHSHTFTASTGGTSTPINFQPKHLVANIFVYLGN